MEDKRSTQLVLPLGLTYEPKHKDIIKQHWNVTFARQGRMSVAAKRIMARVIRVNCINGTMLSPIIGNLLYYRSLL